MGGEISASEFPRSGSKAIDIKEEREKRREREKICNTNGELRIANATSGGARKPPGPIILAVAIGCFRAVLDELWWQIRYCVVTIFLAFSVWLK